MRAHGDGVTANTLSYGGGGTTDLEHSRPGPAKPAHNGMLLPDLSRIYGAHWRVRQLVHLRDVGLATGRLHDPR